MLNSFNILGNSISLQTLINLFVNLKVFPNYFYPTYMHLITDTWNKKRLHENINLATHVWLRQKV